MIILLAGSGLFLFILAPYRRFLFDYLYSLPDVKTILDFGVSGMTELEVVLSDMALAAACESFVEDPVSTLSDMIEGMQWKYGTVSYQEVLQNK